MYFLVPQIEKSLEFLGIHSMLINKIIFLLKNPIDILYMYNKLIHYQVFI